MKAGRMAALQAETLMFFQNTRFLRSAFALKLGWYHDAFNALVPFGMGAFLILKESIK